MFDVSGGECFYLQRSLFFFSFYIFFVDGKIPRRDFFMWKIVLLQTDNFSSPPRMKIERGKNIRMEENCEKY